MRKIPRVVERKRSRRRERESGLNEREGITRRGGVQSQS